MPKLKHLDFRQKYKRKLYTEINMKINLPKLIEFTQIPYKLYYKLITFIELYLNIS